MRFILGVLFAIMVLGGPAIGGYCPPEPRYERLWTSEAIAAQEAARGADGLPVTLLAVLVALLAGVMIGRGIPVRPSLAQVEEAIDKAFVGRVGEARVHRRRKLPPALAAAKRAVLAEVRKLWG